MPKTREQYRNKNKQYRALFKELFKSQTIVLLDVLEANPDGLTYREIVSKFLDRLESIGSFYRMSLTLERLTEMGYITKRRRNIIDIRVIATKKLGKGPVIYYLELPGKNLLIKINEFSEIIEQAKRFKENGICEKCPSTEVRK